MLKKCRNMLRNEKGLTLIELLAVVVILGIIAAIAIPSIGGLIDNSRKDAHAANAQQMVSSTRLVMGSSNELAQGTNYVSLGYLESKNYLEYISSPDGEEYDRGGDDILSGTSNKPSNSSYVEVTEGTITKVFLYSSIVEVEVEADSTTGSININRDNVTKK